MKFYTEQYQNCLFPSETCNTWLLAVVEFAASLKEQHKKQHIRNIAIM